MEQERSDDILPQELPLEIVYEDAWLLLANKPRAWLSIRRMAIIPGRSPTPSSGTGSRRRRRGLLVLCTGWMRIRRGWC